MKNLPRFAWAGTTCIAIAMMLSAASAYQKEDKDKIPKESDARPKLMLKAQPLMAIAPARVVFTAELVGGANDYEEFYCPTIEWDWGDDTRSESNSDCEPYQSGKSEIKRRFTMDHSYKHGGVSPLRVLFRLKHRDKTLVGTSTTIQIRPGLRDIGE